MPVTTSGLRYNIERSLDAYFRANLDVTEALEVHYNHDPVFNAEGKFQWVGIQYNFLAAVRDYDGQWTGTHKVSHVRGMIEFLLATRTQLVRTNLYAPAQLYDKVYKYVEPGTAIPIRDYAPADDPIVGYVHCGDSKGRLLDTGDESDVYQYGLSVETRYLELRT